MSSEKTKRKVEKTKRRSSSSVNAKALKDETKLRSASSEKPNGKKTIRRSVSEQPASRAGSIDAKKSNSSEPTDTSEQRIKPPTPLPNSDDVGSSPSERTGLKSTRELVGERQEMPSRAVKKKTLKVQMKNDLAASAWFFDKAYGFRYEVVREPLTKRMETRQRRQQVQDSVNVDTSDRGKARKKKSSNKSNDLPIPRPCDTPVIGMLVMDSEQSKEVDLERGAAITEILNNLVIREETQPREIPIDADVRFRRDLGALRDVNHGLSSVLNLETRRRLHRVEKPRPASHIHINPQPFDTPMNELSMADLEWVEPLFQESSLHLGSCPSFTYEQNSASAAELVDAREVPLAHKDKKSHRKLSLRRSASCKGRMSTPDKVKAEQGRRSLRRGDSYKESSVRDAFQDLDHKLSSVLNFETRHRLHQVEKPRPTSDVHINPQSYDTPMSGISIDDLELMESLFQESFLHLGSCASFADAQKSALAAELVEAPEVPLAHAHKEKRSQRKSSLRRSASCRGVMSNRDEVKREQGRRSLRRGGSYKESSVRDASQDLDHKLSSVLNLETRHRLHQVEKHRPTSDVHINPQSYDTPMSGVSMDDLELMESLFQESFLHLGSCASFADAQKSALAVELVEAPEVPLAHAHKEKRSQRKSSLRRSASCRGIMSTPAEVKAARRRRSLRRGESYKESPVCEEAVGGLTKEIHRTSAMEANDDNSYEIPLRDDPANNVPCRKAARARRENRKPSHNEKTQRCHRQDKDTHPHDNAHEERSIPPDQHYFELLIPQHCDAPVSGMTMDDLEWVEALYANSILG